QPYRNSSSSLQRRRHLIKEDPNCSPYEEPGVAFSWRERGREGERENSLMLALFSPPILCTGVQRQAGEKYRENQSCPCSLGLESEKASQLTCFHIRCMYRTYHKHVYHQSLRQIKGGVGGVGGGGGWRDDKVIGSLAGTCF
ncbi:hypothetical protein AALO_G00191850, partial [Alosa alosa]